MYYLVINLFNSSQSHRIGSFSKRRKDILFNLLKPTGYVIHHQFNIQQMYAQSTPYLFVLYLSEDKQILVLLTA